MIIGTAKRTKDGEKPKPTRFYSARQEDAVAKVVGGKRTPNSGATDFGGKSDVNISNLFNIECKTKTSNGIPFLVMREVLNTPVTVPNGSSAVISFNLM